MIVQEYSNSINITALRPMEFTVQENPIVFSVGDKTIKLFFGPLYYVKDADNNITEYESRLQADIAFARKIRLARYYHGFDMYCHGYREPEDKDERRGWHAASRAQAQAEYNPRMAQQEIHDARNDAPGWW